MGLGDICGEVIQGYLQVVENDRVPLAFAVLGVLDKTMGEFIEKLGIPRGQLAITGSKCQKGISMPWNLSPGCALRIEHNWSIAGACYEALTSQICLQGQKTLKIIRYGEQQILFFRNLFKPIRRLPHVQSWNTFPVIIGVIWGKNVCEPLILLGPIMIIRLIISYGFLKETKKVNRCVRRVGF